MKEKIKKKELVKSILRALKRPFEEDFTEEDLNSIENISIGVFSDNGEETGIEISDLVCFPNLKSVTLKDFCLTEKEYQTLSLFDLENISFYKCFFEEFDFNHLSIPFKNLRFISCKNLPKKLPSLSEIIIDSCDVDFNSISLDDARSIVIVNSNIQNIHNLENYPNLEQVVLDGSRLYLEDGSEAIDIIVGGKSVYSHEEKVKFPVDFRPGDDVIKKQKSTDEDYIRE